MRPFEGPRQKYLPGPVCAPHTRGTCRKHRAGPWWYPFGRPGTLCFAPYECRPIWKLAKKGGWVPAGTRSKPRCSNFRQERCEEDVQEELGPLQGWCQECGAPSQEGTCNDCFRDQRLLDLLDRSYG